MTRIQGDKFDRGDTDIVIARIKETYNQVANGQLSLINGLGIQVKEAGDYLIEGLAIITANELSDASYEVHLSGGTMVSDFTVNDPTNALDQVQVENNASLVSVAQGQHAWRVVGTLFDVPAGGTIEMRLGQEIGTDPFLVLRGGFLRLTKLT